MEQKNTLNVLEYISCNKDLLRERGMSYTKNLGLSEVSLVLHNSLVKLKDFGPSVCICDSFTHALRCFYTFHHKFNESLVHMGQ